MAAVPAACAASGSPSRETTSAPSAARARAPRESRQCRRRDRRRAMRRARRRFPALSAIRRACATMLSSTHYSDDGRPDCAAAPQSAAAANVAVIESATRCAHVSAVERSAASTITRNTGSVPDGRSRMRPASPSAARAVVFGRADRRAAFPVEPFRHADIDEPLREQRHRSRRRGQRVVVAVQRAQHGERGD